MKRKSILKSIALFAVVLFSASCASIRHDVMMGDVITFSEQASTNFSTIKGKQTDPYIIHTDRVKYDPKEVLKLKQQIKNAPYGVNTSLAYALDLGLDRIKYIRNNQLKRDKLAKYYIFLLTDGLDNTSVDVARNNKQGNYKNIDAYQKKLKKKIKKLMGNGKEQNLFQIYPMLAIGPDLEEFHQDQFPEKNNDEFADLCRDTYMEPYRGSSKGYETPEAIVAYSYKQVLDDIKKLFSTAAFEFYVPKGYAGTRIKMNLADSIGNKAWFEGDVVKKGKKYYLKNITFSDRLDIGKEKKKVEPKKGKKRKIELTSTNNSDKNAIKAWFRLENLLFDNNPYKVDMDKVRQAYFEKKIDKFQPNSEYARNAKPEIDTYFQFIMDTSGSVGEDAVDDEQKVLFEILNVITHDIKQD